MNVTSSNTYPLKPLAAPENPKTLSLSSFNSMSLMHTAEKIFNKVADEVVDTFAERVAHKLLDEFENAAKKVWAGAGSVLGGLGKSTSLLSEKSGTGETSSYALPAEPTRVLTGRPRGFGI